MTLWLALAWYGVWSVVSVALYGADKRAAGRGAWRIPEKTLHTVDLLGGWPGGALARRVFRHKTSKWSFLIVSWSIAALHGVAWGAVWWLKKDAGSAG